MVGLDGLIMALPNLLFYNSVTLEAVDVQGVLHGPSADLHQDLKKQMPKVRPLNTYLGWISGLIIFKRLISLQLPLILVTQPL